MPTNNNLPEKFPEDWLKQLKDALRQDTRKALLWTLLGSSVVASVVTAGANMILETMKLNNTAEIEKYKACLDLRREEVKELRTVYSTVAQKLRQFEKDFDNCLTTCEDASDTRKKKRQSPRDAYDALIAAAKGLAEIQALARDTRVSADLRSSLLDMNERVIRNISATLDNDRQLAKIDKLPEFVASGRTDLQPKIVQIKVQMETATKSLKAESCNSN